VIPLIGCLALHFAIGGRIKDIHVAIVNNEISSINDCLNKSMSVPKIDGFSCSLNKVSCRFIDELKPEDMNLVSWLKQWQNHPINLVFSLD
jgi:hypothetical protein